MMTFRTSYPNKQGTKTETSGPRPNRGTARVGATRWLSFDPLAEQSDGDESGSEHRETRRFGCAGHESDHFLLCAGIAGGIGFRGDIGVRVDDHGVLERSQLGIAQPLNPG